MKTLTLSKSKWICGSPKIGNNNEGAFLGKGNTRLLNEDGYMCCLGQWSLQLANINPAFILDKGEPADLYRNIPLLLKPEEPPINSQFSYDAMAINDSTDTTIEEKISRLTQLCKEHGYELIITD